MQSNNDQHQYYTTGANGGGLTEPPPRQSYFRLLCHVSKSGGVIGKSGTIVKLIEQETGAKIRFDDIAPTCEERVVHVVSPQTPTKTIALKRGEGEVGAKEDEEEERREKHEVSAAQHALVRVFERVLEVEADIGGGGAYPKVSQCRLLAPGSSIGFLIGKERKRLDKFKVMTYEWRQC